MAKVVGIKSVSSFAGFGFLFLPDNSTANGWMVVGWSVLHVSARRREAVHPIQVEDAHMEGGLSGSLVIYGLCNSDIVIFLPCDPFTFPDRLWSIGKELDISCI